MKNIFWGLLLIVVGIIWGCNVLGFTNIQFFFAGWWTLIIIIPCFIGLFTDAEKKWNFIGLITGIVLLLCCQNILEFQMVLKLFLPFVLVVIGLSFLFKDSLKTKINKEIKKINQAKNKEYCTTFSSQTIDYTKEEFLGANISSVFGETTLDLRKAIIKENRVITCSSIFGSISIRVPENVNVKVKANSIFGGVENDHQKTEEEITIYVNASCLFGGVDIE